MKQRKAVQLFDEKYKRLARSGFAQKALDGGDASEDEIDAYLLTLRFFIQDREPCSMRNMSKLYDTECENDQAKQEFNEIREHFNAELDRKSPFPFHSGKIHKEGESEYLTYRYIFFGLLYAIFAHSEWEKYELVPEMMSSSFGRHLNMSMFTDVLRLCHRTIRDMNAANRSAFPNCFD